MCPSELHVVSHQHSKPQNPFKRKIPLKMHKSNHRKISGSRTFIACKNLHLLAFFVTIHKCNQRYREEKRLLHSLSNLKIQESKKKVEICNNCSGANAKPWVKSFLCFHFKIQCLKITPQVYFEFFMPKKVYI